MAVNGQRGTAAGGVDCRLTEPFEVSTDHPICRPRPPRVSRNKKKLLFVSSGWLPCQSSSSSRGEMTLFNSSKSAEERGRIKGEVSLMICSMGGSNEERRKETFLVVGPVVVSSRCSRGRGGKRGECREECGDEVEVDTRAGRLGGMVTCGDTTWSWRLQVGVE